MLPLESLTAKSSRLVGQSLTEFLIINKVTQQLTHHTFPTSNKDPEYLITENINKAPLVPNPASGDNPATEIKAFIIHRTAFHQEVLAT